MENQLTIGELAKSGGVRPSALRYYEAEGLLEPSGRSRSGYRLYAPESADTLHFIRRAQRLGFSLADIRTLLHARQREGGGDAVTRIAEARVVELERQITPLLVQRHELSLFLRDLRAQEERAGAGGGLSPLERIVDRVCTSPFESPAEVTLDDLVAATGCRLDGAEGQALLRQLRGQHVHVWQEGDEYHILVVTDDPEVGAVLERLASLETGCQSAAHGDEAPELMHDEEGFLFIARGAHAFLFARLFLALEHGEARPHGVPARPAYGDDRSIA